jgi:hypothetical protein
MSTPNAFATRCSAHPQLDEGREVVLRPPRAALPRIPIPEFAGVGNPTN